jgi:phage tail-like protein
MGGRSISEPREVHSAQKEEGTMSRIADPAGSHTFALEIDGIEVAHFLGCSGVKSQVQVFEIEEGGVNGYVHKRPAGSAWQNVTLRAATHTSHLLWDWRERCRGGDLSRRSSGAIILYDVDGRPAERFDLDRVWPVRWSGPDLDSGGSDVGVEEIEIAFEGVTVS